MWRPTAHNPEALERFRTRRVETGIGGVVVPCPLPRQPGRRRRRDLREVDRRDARDARRRRGDRSGRRHLPRRLASRVGLRRRAQACRPRAAAAPRALRRANVAADGELGRPGGTIGRSVDELEVLFDGSAAIRGSGSASTRATVGVRRTTSPTRRRERGRRRGRTPRRARPAARAPRQRCAAALGSNRDRHANVLEGQWARGLGVFLAEPAFQGLPRSSKHPAPRPRPRRAEIPRLRDLHKRAAAAHARRRVKADLSGGAAMTSTGDLTIPRPLHVATADVPWVDDWLGVSRFG